MQWSVHPNGNRKTTGKKLSMLLTASWSLETDTRMNQQDTGFVTSQISGDKTKYKNPLLNTLYVYIINY